MLVLLRGLVSKHLALNEHLRVPYEKAQASE